MEVGFSLLLGLFQYCFLSQNTTKILFLLLFIRIKDFQKTAINEDFERKVRRFGSFVKLMWNPLDLMWNPLLYAKHHHFT